MSAYPEQYPGFKSEIVKFRGEEFAANFRFASQYEEEEEIAVGTIVGIALAFLASDKNQVLVWLGEEAGVGSMSRSNYKKHKNNGGF